MKKSIVGCILIGSMIVMPAWALQFLVNNNLAASSSCPNGNTVTLFTGQSQPTIEPGGNTTISGDFSQGSGLGIQVNNWYWTRIPAPVQGGQTQNPDNSGAQFTISDNCEITGKSAAWFGEGIQTYLIANVTTQMQSGVCTITISQNDYTNAVTPNCCAPPIFPTNVCTGPYGVTNTGQLWPPSD